MNNGDPLTLELIIVILQLISTGAVIATVFIIRKQLREMRRDTQAQAYGVAREILQDEKVRKARGRVFHLDSHSQSIDKWSESDKELAGIVCHTYDSVGQMVRNKLLWKEIIIDSWGPSIQGLWPIVLPLVKKYRNQWDAEKYWDDFEWLYDQVLKAEAAQTASEE